MLDKLQETCIIAKVIMNGRLAQLGEHLPYKQRVGGSIPSTSMMARWRSGLTHQPFTLAFTGSNPVRVIGAVVQLVRMPACHAGGRGFEPHLRRWPR